MEKEKLRGRIDWITTLIPFVIVLSMMLVFMLIPTQSKLFVDTLRGFFGDTIGILCHTGYRKRVGFFISGFQGQIWSDQTWKCR